MGTGGFAFAPRFMGGRGWWEVLKKKINFLQKGFFVNLLIIPYFQNQAK